MDQVKPYVKVNDYSGSKELIVDATIISISDEVKMNGKNNQYRLATVRANMGSGNYQTGRTCIWEKLHESNGYEKGDEVALAIQLESEDPKYIGYSKLFLEGASAFDVSEFVASDGVAMKATP